jgi:two-component system response regulator YesN
MDSEINVCLLSALIALLEEAVEREGQSPLTAKISSYINSNYMKRITLEDIGRLTFFSPIYCDTVFKKDTGRSIIDHLIERRIDEAKKHLSSHELSLSKIAGLCGFTDYNYFCRVFKSEVGSTPLAYRKEKRKKPSGAK